MDVTAGGSPHRTYVGKGTTVADVAGRLEALERVRDAADRLYVTIEPMLPDLCVELGQALEAARG